MSRGNLFGPDRKEFEGGRAMPLFEIRELKSLEEFRACERIQLEVWGTLGVGSEVISVTAKYGGAIVGALTRGKVVGFIYAFLARRHGRLVHWSHMMAVSRRFRDRGLGFRMKLVHCRLALAQGLKSICWTYDPLQSRNAALNIARLGGLVEEYIENCYGRFPSRIEQGLPSDRFVVDWRIGSARVAGRLAARRRDPAIPPSLPFANHTRANPQGFAENRSVQLDLRQPRVAVEVPSNTDDMRRRDLRLALRWRMETRRIFQSYFSRHYRVVDFISSPGDSGVRSFYILAHR